MIRALRRLGWWVRDYAYVTRWQARALRDRTDPERFRSGTGTAVLIVPGVYETWRFMQPLVERIHAAGHPVHVVTHLRRNRMPVADGAHQVEAYLATRDLRDVVLVAHSKGGLIGKQVMVGPSAGRIRGMVAVAAPFGGSRYARLMLMPTLRSFSPRNAGILALAAHVEANARIVSVYGSFDPHIPEGSALAGATNVMLDTGGHFRVLAHPRVLDEVLRLAR